jgi:hypothetical protein
MEKSLAEIRERRKKTTLLEGSQALHTGPFNKVIMKVKTSQWHEVVALHSQWNFYFTVDNFEKQLI